VAFGKRLAEQGMIQSDVAECRLDIESHRLLVLKAAHMMDTGGNKVPRPPCVSVCLSVSRDQSTDSISGRQVDEQYQD